VRLRLLEVLLPLELILASTCRLTWGSIRSYNR